MRNKPTLDIVFYAYEALFRDDIELQETCLPKISDVPIKLIDNFPAHQFMVIMDEDMEYLIESIKNKERFTSLITKSSSISQAACRSKRQLNISRILWYSISRIGPRDQRHNIIDLYRQYYNAQNTNVIITL